MNRTVFTPGPWVIVKVGGEYTIRLTHTADGRKITKIICKMPKRIRRDKLLANAALIAAAPELYDALETVLKKVKCHDAVCLESCAYFEDETRECKKFGGKCPIQKWVDLLAKARGEVVK